jgi:hypothetical protein
MAFLGHGLLASFFMMTCLIAASAHWRTRARTQVSRLLPGGTVAYLSIVLLLCKSAGALIYAISIVPLVMFTSRKFQMRVAIAFAVLSLAYPTLRSFDLFPTEVLVSSAASISSERAASLDFRFQNEDELLAKASQRFWFGWGRFGRNRIYNEYGDQSVTDGHWIITLGQFGFMGFFFEFGLLVLPVFFAFQRRNFPMRFSDGIFLSSLSLIVAIRIVDQLPNSSLSPWTWLVAGALLGRAESLSQSSSRVPQGRTPTIGKRPSPADILT